MSSTNALVEYFHSLQRKAAIEGNVFRKADLARKLGVSRQTLDNWLAGRWKPNRRHAVAIEKRTDGAVTAGSWEDEDETT